MFKINLLKYQYPNSDFTLELSNLDFRKPEIVAFIGSNGCGKSTFYRVLSGVLTAKEFQVTHNGNQYNSLIDTPLKIGSHNAFSDLQSALTVRQNLEFIASINGIAPTKQLIHDKAGLIGVESLLNRYPSELSAGQQHRVKLARTLVHDPDIILLDEPTTASDIKNIEIILALIQELQAQGKYVFISTHHLYELALLKPRLVGIKNGKQQYDKAWDGEFEKSEVLQEQMRELIDYE